MKTSNKKSYLKSINSIMATTCVIGLFLTFNANAQFDNTASLKSYMKTMSSKLKTIASQVSNPSKNSENETLSNEFIQTVEQAKNVLPSDINNLPPTQQVERKATYIKMMDQTVQLGKELALAFHNNDNAAANVILGKLSQEKKDGHNEFKN